MMHDRRIMQRQRHRQIQWLEFDLLADCSDLQHGVFLRHGGNSTGPYASLNCGLDIGDDNATVAANRRLALDTLACPDNPTTLHWAFQRHGTNVAEVTPQRPSPIPDSDALITDHPHCALLIKHADCQAAIIYDPVNHAVAAVHSGWRGSVANIYAETIRTMQQRYDSKPEDLLVGVSPSMGPEAAEFIHYKTELPEPFWEYQVSPQHFDFWAITETQLQQCGVLPHHIEIARLCTHSNPQDYFSYRRDKTTGRHGTLVVLRPRNTERTP